jgi:hypothetical protein
MKKRSRFRIVCGPWTVDVNANNPGNAYRKVFAALISQRRIERQPRQAGPGFRDCVCVCLGPAI